MILRHERFVEMQWHDLQVTEKDVRQLRPSGRPARRRHCRHGPDDATSGSRSWMPRHIEGAIDRDNNAAAPCCSVDADCEMTGVYAARRHPFTRAGYRALGLRVAELCRKKAREGTAADGDLSSSKSRLRPVCAAVIFGLWPP